MSEDWDDSGPTVVPQNSVISDKENAAPFGNFSKGKGLGRGVLKQFPDNSSNGPSKAPGGFGGAQVNGFGAANNNNNVNDEWDETGSSVQSFGGNNNNTSSRGGFGGFGRRNNDDSNNDSSSSRGGFGGRGGRGGFGGFGKRDENGDDSGSSSRGGFGSRGRGGFGGGFGKRSDNNDDDSSRGGFGSGGGGGFGGFGKKDDGAPRGGGFGRGGGGGSGDRGRGCFKCGEEGHMSRECPSQSSSSRGRGCFKCGEEGHMSRECPNQDSSSSRGKGCFKCGEEGHMSRECPNQDSSSSRGKGCFKCGEEGHMSRECPNQDSSSSRGKGCFKCGEEGHMSRECPNQDSSSKGKGCFKCGEDGHMARDCTNEAKTEDGKPREAPYIPPPPPESEEDIFKSIQKGINFDKYDQIPVDVTGRDPPSAISSFEEAGLYKAFHENVVRSHYEKPTPVQKYSIPIIMAGRDLMACAQTGSGKTAAFLLPVLTGMMNNGLTGSEFSPVQEPQALVIAPTRELACQINEDARKFSHKTMLRPVVVYGGTSTNHQLSNISRGAHIVIGTPGRLSDFINRGKISLEKLKYLILDEADRMLDMGFEPEVRKIVEQFGMPSKSERQTLMFSATFPEEIQKLASDFLNDYIFLSVGRVGGANTDVEQHVFEVERQEKRQKLCDILSDAGTDKTLVFVEQKRNADFLASYLSQSGFPTTSIHGDRLQREREEALRDFKTGRAPILVATSVAARGLDIPEVKHVVNYDLPQSIDEYVHRIGRTGRCGNLGRATSFYSNDSDGALAKALLRVLADAHQEVPDWLESYSVGGMSDFSSSRFGGRDIRKGKFDSSKQSSGGFQQNATPSFTPAADDDESWD